MSIIMVSVEKQEWERAQKCREFLRFVQDCASACEGETDCRDDCPWLGVEGCISHYSGNGADVLMQMAYRWGITEEDLTDA